MSDFTDQLPAENYLPPHGEDWKFNQKVTDSFDAMLVNSIPSYMEMRRFTDMFMRRHVANTMFPHILDLGSSRGEVVDRHIKEGGRTRFELVEVSHPMLDVLHQRYDPAPHVNIHDLDMRYRHAEFKDFAPTMVTCVLTTIFTPLSYRQAILKSIHEALAPRGGTFIWVEKILGEGAIEDELLTTAYYKFKSDNGYTEEAIQRKKLALEFAQVPVTAEWNENMLRKAGFSVVQQYWQALNFAGWIAKC